VHHSSVLVALTTNGTIMNERRMGSLLESGLHLIDVSIDAFTPETYARRNRLFRAVCQKGGKGKC